MTGYRILVRYLLQEDASENFKIKPHCRVTDWTLVVDSECVTKETPQQNLMLETLFTTLATQEHTMMTAVIVLVIEWYSLFQEAVSHVTKSKWLSIVKIPKVTGIRKVKIEYYGTEIPLWTNYSHTWREIGTVETKRNKKYQIGDC